MNSMVKLDGILTMSSLEIAELTGKEHKNVMVDIRSMLESLGKAVADFSATAFYEVNNAKRTRDIFNLPKRETLILVSGYNVLMRANIIDRWQELEAKQNPKIPLTYIQALERLIETEKQKEAALELAKVAIETKAEIGSRREATAMNTASQAVKKANKLEIELDQSKYYCTVKRMEMLKHGQKFSWRLLKSAGQDLGIDSIDIYDANYGSVKAYHRDVWLEAYALTF